MFHIIEGVVSVRKDGVEVRQQWKGHTFGALTVTGELVASRTPTMVCVVDCVVVKLSRADYLRICGALETEVVRILGEPSDARSEADVAVLLGMLREAHLFKILYYERLQKACCKAMQLERLRTGETVCSQGSIGDSIRVLLQGQVEVTTVGSNEKGTYSELRCHLSIKTICLPRQARDKHRERKHSKKSGRVFLRCPFWRRCSSSSCETENTTAFWR
eukprot:COSAG06_NODE_215_length_20124_cov_3.931735_23_plen_218_part_00